MNRKITRVIAILTAMFMLFSSSAGVMAAEFESNEAGAYQEQQSNMSQTEPTVDVETEESFQDGESETVDVETEEPFQDGESETVDVETEEPFQDGESEITDVESEDTVRTEPNMVGSSRTAGYYGAYTINTNYDFLIGYQWDSIWIGDTQGIRLKWNVTKNHGDYLTMVTDSFISRTKTYPDTDAIGWHDSTLRSWLNNYQGDFDGLGTVANPYADSFLDGFTPCELNAFLETEVVNNEAQSMDPLAPGQFTLTTVNTKDKFYIPDYNDTKGLTGFDSNKNKLGTNWSIRSLINLGSGRALFVTHNGDVALYAKGEAFGVRPMCSLDLNAVAFLEDSNMKEPQGLAKIYETANTSWMAVLFDPGQKFSVASDSVIKTGRKKYRIPFVYQYDSNAENASGQNAASVAAMITEGDYKDGNVKYYGIVGNIGDGYAEITLPEDFDPAIDKMYLMSKATDPYKYVSQMQEVQIPGTEIIFHANGGEGEMENQILPFGQTVLLQDNKFTRDGYYMNGWSTTEDGLGVYYKNLETMDEDNITASPLHLHAQWKPAEYTIQFDKNAENAEGTMQEQTLRYDEEKALNKNQYQYEHHAFAGWALTPDGTTTYTDGQTVRNLINTDGGKVTLYAVWNETGDVKYTVEHYKQNQDETWSDTAAEKESYSAKAGTTAKARPKSYEGYIFDSSIKGTIISGTVAEDGSLTLKLYYRAAEYTILFDKNQENAEGTMQEQILRYDEEKALNKNQYQYKHHTFAGWALTSDGAVAYADEHTVKNLIAEDGGKITLYAVWNEIGDVQYAVEHYKQNPDGTWPDSAVEQQQFSSTAGSTVKAQPKEYKGYVFDPSAEGNVSSGTVAEDGSLILKLYYRVCHIVSFDPNGGNNTPDDQSVIHGSQADEPKNPTKDGYIFDGWYYKDKDGKEKKWFFGDPVTGDMKLTAHWKKSEKPIVTDKPGTPSKPGISSGTRYPGDTTSKSTVVSKIQKMVKTGDTTNIVLFIVLLAVSGSIVLVMVIKKRKKVYGKK